MTQYNFENIDPYVDTGVDLAADLNGWKGAVQSCHKGSTRPAYAAMGTLWINDTADPWKVNVYNGTVDVEIGKISATTNSFIPTLSTPVQFNSSVLPATTEFVQRALGNKNRTTDISTAQTLTAAMAGSLLSITAGGITVSLPNGSSLTNGATFMLKNTYGSSAATIIPPSGDVFGVGNGITLSSISLGVGEEVSITAFGSTWIAHGGATMKYMSSFGSSLSASGYQKLPSGLIIQWGGATSSATADVTVTYPIAFTIGAYALLITPGTYGQGAFANSGSNNATTFNFSTWTAVNTRVGLTSNSWLAIGR